MVVKYKPSTRLAKVNIKKYLKVSKTKMSLVKKLAILKGIESTAIKGKEREIKLRDKHILVIIDGQYERLIKYKSIKDIAIDDEDIIIVNPIQPLVIPRLAFAMNRERNEFIAEIMDKFEGAKFNMQSSVMNSNIDFFESGNDKNTNTDKIIIEDTISMKRYCDFKSTADLNIDKAQINRGLGNLVFGILIAIFISFLGFNHMGAFADKEFYIGLVGIIAIIVIYAFVGIKLINSVGKKYKKKISAQKIKVKYEIFDSRVFIEEGMEFRTFKINEIEQLLRTKKGVFFTTKNSAGEKEAFYIIQSENISNDELDEFNGILVNMIEYYDENFEHKRKKSNSGFLTVVKRVVLILWIISFPLTVFLVPHIAPNYYARITHNKEVREQAKVIQIIKDNLYKGSIQSNKRVEQSGTSNQTNNESNNSTENIEPNNNNNNSSKLENIFSGNSEKNEQNKVATPTISDKDIAHNYEKLNLTSAQLEALGNSQTSDFNTIEAQKQSIGGNNNYKTILQRSEYPTNATFGKNGLACLNFNPYIKERVYGLIKKYDDGTLTIPKEYSYTSKSAMEYLNNNWGTHIEIPASEKVLQNLSMDEGELTDWGVTGVSGVNGFLGRVAPYVYTINDPNLQKAVQKAFEQILVDKELVNLKEGAYDLRVLNMEMPSSVVQNYAGEVILPKIGAASSSTITVGPVQIKDGNFLYRLVFIHDKLAKKYYVFDVNEAGGYGNIAPVTDLTQDPSVGANINVIS
ncbi:hypothetical protein [uncultured Clostridium sp.]|uniref:hypothetical protein n=1 Tax=uncultured Clostridium sp. TaxID=59620 RepID=UPI002633AC57|nr:hypothetical protein [uncultured Clostridium sp.]